MVNSSLIAFFNRCSGETSAKRLSTNGAQEARSVFNSWQLMFHPLSSRLGRLQASLVCSLCSDNSCSKENPSVVFPQIISAVLMRPTCQHPLLAQQGLGHLRPCHPHTAPERYRLRQGLHPHRHLWRQLRLTARHREVHITLRRPQTVLDDCLRASPTFSHLKICIIKT